MLAQGKGWLICSAIQLLCKEADQGESVGRLADRPSEASRKSRHSGVRVVAIAHEHTLSTSEGEEAHIQRSSGQFLG